MLHKRSERHQVDSMDSKRQKTCHLAILILIQAAPQSNASMLMTSAHSARKSTRSIQTSNLSLQLTKLSSCTSITLRTRLDCSFCPLIQLVNRSFSRKSTNKLLWKLAPTLSQAELEVIRHLQEVQQALESQCLYRKPLTSDRLTSIWCWKMTQASSTELSKSTPSATIVSRQCLSSRAMNK